MRPISTFICAFVALLSFSSVGFAQDRQAASTSEERVAEGSGGEAAEGESSRRGVIGLNNTKENPEVPVVAVDDDD